MEKNLNEIVQVWKLFSKKKTPNYSWFGVSKNDGRKRFSRFRQKSKLAQRPRFRGTGRPQIRPPRPSEAEVLPEGLDVFLGVLGGHVGVVWRAPGVVASGASQPTAGLASSRRRRRRSGLRVIFIYLGQCIWIFCSSTYKFLMNSLDLPAGDYWLSNIV